jgi:hypothetical protein
MKKLFGFAALLLASSLALGATVPRLFPEGVKLETIQAKGANGVKVKNSSGTDILTVSEAGAAVVGRSDHTGFHRFYAGNYGITVSGKDTPYNIAFGRSNSAVGWGVLGADSTSAFRLYAGGTGASPSAGTELGNVTQAGAWTWGPTTGGTTHGWYGGIRTLSSEMTLSDGVNMANKTGATVNNAVGNINCLTGGVYGQIIYIRMGGSGSATFKFNSTCAGQQKIFPPGGLDLLIDAYHSAILLFDGTNWVVLSHTK